jgi:hypothetical protein
MLSGMTLRGGCCADDAESPTHLSGCVTVCRI